MNLIPTFIFLRNNIFIRFLGYLEYVFLFNSIMIGFVFFSMPILLIGNFNIPFSQKMGSAIEIFSNFFSIRTPEKFISAIVILFLIVSSLIGYLFSIIFRKLQRKINFGYRMLMVEITYIFLIIFDAITFYFYNQEFSLEAFFGLFFGSVFGLVFYALSYLCNIFRNKLKKETF